MIDYSQKELLILAFDHRASFLEKMFGIENRQPTIEEKLQIEDYKKIIFEGFTKSIKNKAPKELAGLLVNEQFGCSALREAKKESLTFALPVEKSSHDEFDLDYGENFAKHIEEFDPSYVKVLVRYNPESDATLNLRQLQRLKKFGDYLAQKKRAFLFELIASGSSIQLSSINCNCECIKEVN
jgi:5-dehydro-2-deoxygluconokinase